jgi:hypothetical protein
MATFYNFMTRSESDVLVGPCALIFRTKALLEVENVVLGIHTPLLKFISFASPYLQLIFCIILDDVEVAFLLYLQKHYTSKNLSSVPQRNTDHIPFFWQLFLA